MKQVMDNSTDSTTTTSPHPQLPPGFRFHPTDEELVVHYLKRKADSAPLPVTIIAEVDLYKFDPWELPSKATFGEQEWYFFSPRDRKYPNGARPNRAATSGYWKATGTDKPILSSDGNQKVGVKKALVFYGGKPPKGVKTNWIMHEYRLTDKSIPKPPVAAAADHAQTNNDKKTSLRLDDWVLCRIYKKPNNMQRAMMMEQYKDDSMAALIPSMPTLTMMNTHQNIKPTGRGTNYGALGGIDNDDNFLEGILAAELTIQQHGSESHYELGSCMAKNTFSLKRQLPSQFWNETAAGSMGTSSASKRFHGDLNSGNSNGSHEDNNSFISLLSQIPQNTSFHHNGLLGSVSDGALRQQFQLSSVNWNS